MRLTVPPRRDTGKARRPARAIGIISGSLLLLLLLTHTLTLEPTPSIRIPWNSKIPPVDRLALERQFQLTNGNTIDAQIWSYDLTDTSSRNIRALLIHPSVIGTTFLDRETATVSADAPQGDTTMWLGDRVPLFNRRGVAKTLAIVLAGLTATAGAMWLMVAGYLPSPTRLVTLLTRAIPSLGAEALGLYRIGFACGLAFVLNELRMTNWAAPGETHPDGAWLADWFVFHWIANRPDLVGGLELLTVGTITLFGIGLWTRRSYGFMVVNFTLWTLVRLQHTGTHPWGVLLITLWCLLVIRWGDGLSLDNAISRWRGRPVAPAAEGQAYGFAVWLPGLVLGTAMSAAAFAKLYNGGLNWVLGGAVKYHFVIDSVTAPVAWGLWIASHHWIAIAASAFAVGMEGSLIVAVLLRPGWRRAALSAGGFALLLGFYLFQNEVWWAWWMLWACFFIPWARLWSRLNHWYPKRSLTFDASVSISQPPPNRPLTRVHYGLISAICGLQLFASVFQIEQQPVLSDYPMYSNTYSSTTAFDVVAPIKSSYRFYARTPDGENDVTTALERTSLDSPLRDFILRLQPGQLLTPDMKARLHWIALTFHERSGQSLGVLTLIRDELAFNWSTGHLYGKDSTETLPVLDTETLTIVPIGDNTPPQ